MWRRILFSTYIGGIATTFLILFGSNMFFGGAAMTNCSLRVQPVDETNTETSTTRRFLIIFGISTMINSGKYALFWPMIIPWMWLKSRTYQPNYKYVEELNMILNVNGLLSYFIPLKWLTLEIMGD